MHTNIHSHTVVQYTLWCAVRYWTIIYCAVSWERLRNVALRTALRILSLAPCRRTAVFQCPDTNCLSQKRRRVAGDVMQQIPQCGVCGREMMEIRRARDTGDQVLGLLISPSALENPGPKDFIRHQSALVCFQGMLSMLRSFSSLVLF